MLSALALLQPFTVQKKPSQAAARSASGEISCGSVGLDERRSSTTRVRLKERHYHLRICGSDEHFKHRSVIFWILIMTIECTVH